MKINEANIMAKLWQNQNKASRNNKNLNVLRENREGGGWRQCYRSIRKESRKYSKRRRHQQKIIMKEMYGEKKNRRKKSAIW